MDIVNKAHRIDLRQLCMIKQGDRIQINCRRSEMLSFFGIERLIFCLNSIDFCQFFTATHLLYEISPNDGWKADAKE